MYPRSIRIRPSAPPLLFWNVSASTTCSRVTLPILVSTRPIGRPWSCSMEGIPPAPAGGGTAPPPLEPTLLGPPVLLGGLALCPLPPAEGAAGRDDDEEGLLPGVGD